MKWGLGAGGRRLGWGRVAGRADGGSWWGIAGTKEEEIRLTVADLPLGYCHWRRWEEWPGDHPRLAEKLSGCLLTLRSQSAGGLPSCPAAAILLSFPVVSCNTLVLMLQPGPLGRATCLPNMLAELAAYPLT